jgi:TRAP transporter 4TM/12TM fusion protein
MSQDKTQEAKYRQYKGVMAGVVSVLAVAFSLYHVAYIGGFLDAVKIFLDTPLHLSIHMGFMLALVFLIVPASKKASKEKLPFYDAILGLLGVGWNLYILINYYALYERSMTGYLALPETIACAINILIVLEAARRVLGLAIPIVTASFIAYTLTSQYMPGFLFSKAHSWERVAHYIGLFVSGMYGNTLNISATIVVSFILFAQFLFVTGAGDWFIKMAQALLGFVRGGPAKVAILASAFMGTLAGSGMANVATTGVFTIPLMKKTGYRPYFAGAVEAAASNGGQIMPPVMGIAAFIMIDFLDMPYSKIITAAALPAMAYFLAVFLMVDLEAAKRGIRGISRDQLPGIKQTLMEGWQFIVPLVLLLILLVGLQYSPPYSALFATGSLIVIAFFNKANRINLRKIYLALKNTAVVMMMMAIILALAGVIIGCVQLTGLSYRLSMGLVNFAGGSTWLMLGLTAVASVLLGMGMTTSAVYITLAVLVVPALNELGFIPLATHFYVFYFGVSALVTPPVCPTSFVAAGIANSEPMRTGFTAARLAIVGFIVPIIFIFNPALLLVGSITSIVLVTITTVIATIGLSVGFSGYMFGRFHFIWRIPLIAGALLIVYPSGVATIIGIGLIAATTVYQFIVTRVQTPQPVPIDE